MTCFQKPIDDTDTASYKLEQSFLLPLLYAARQNTRTASNAVNKVRNLEVSTKAGEEWAQSGSYNWSHKVNKININEFQSFCLHCMLTYVVQRFLQYLLERKSLYLQQQGIEQEEVQRMLSMLQNQWKK